MRRLTLDGVSYGTFVAEHYALEHPTRVAALVLDSVVPQEGINPFQLETIHAVPRVLRSACAARHCAGDPVADLAAVVRARHDGPQLLDMLVTLSIADPSYRAVPRALSEARAGRPARLERLEAAVRRGDRAPAALLSQGLHASTLCEDYPQPWGGPGAPPAARRAAIRRAAAGLGAAALAPFDRATATGNGELLTCEEWPPLPAARAGLPPGPAARAGAAAGRGARPVHAADLGQGRAGPRARRAPRGGARRRPLCAAARRGPGGAPRARALPAAVGCARWHR